MVACGFCLAPGVSVSGEKKATIRYVNDGKNHELRTHESLIRAYKILKSASINGIKSKSCLVAAKNFDLILGFPIDYMHYSCVLLGNMKKILSLWMDTKNHTQPFYMNKKNQIILSNRIVKIKPVSEITRKPRSLFSRGDFKANEYRSLLYYYLWYALDGLLDKKYIKHFKLLSSAIYTLPEKTISQESIEEAEIKLIEYVNNFEILYGKSNVTMNLHLLKHVAMQVANLGPLWCQSAFAFEANNGNVVKSIKSTKDIIHQLTWKYLMKEKVKAKKGPDCVDDYSIGNGRKMIISRAEKDIFNNDSVEIQSNILTIYKKVVIRGVKYTSQQLNEISTIDYFIRLKYGRIGAIKYFTVLNCTLYALVDIYKVLHKDNHFFQTVRSNDQDLVKIINIAEKAIDMKFGIRECITFIPNKFEKT